MKRAIIYARTSSQESDKTESIPDQIKRCISYCKRAGYDVINKPETDPDIAGQWYPPQYAELAELERDYLLSAMPSVKKMHYRSGLGNVLNQLSNIDAIVCISRSRFDRSLEHSYLAQKLRRDLSEHNVVLDCLGTIHDYSKSNTTGIDQLLQTQAKAAKREEMISGLNAKNNIREKGFVGAGNKNSYGYEHRGKQTVDILPDEAEIVKRIYHEFTNDKPINAIVQQFNYEKIPRFSPNRKKSGEGTKIKTNVGYSKG